MYDKVRGTKEYIKTLSPEERKEYVFECSKIVENKVFNREIDRLIEDTVYVMAEEWQGELLHNFGKGIINGLEKLRENLTLLHGEALQHIEDSKKDDVSIDALQDMS